MDETWGATHAGCPNVRDATGGGRAKRAVDVCAVSVRRRSSRARRRRCVRRRDTRGATSPKPSTGGFSRLDSSRLCGTDRTDRSTSSNSICVPGFDATSFDPSRPFSTKTSRWKKHARDGFQAHRGASGGTRDARASDDACVTTRCTAAIAATAATAAAPTGAASACRDPARSRPPAGTAKRRPGRRRARAGAPPSRSARRPPPSARPAGFRCSPRPPAGTARTLGGYGGGFQARGSMSASGNFQVDAGRGPAGGPAGGPDGGPAASSDRFGAAAGFLRRSRTPVNPPETRPQSQLQSQPRPSPDPWRTIPLRARRSANRRGRPPPDVLPRLVRHHRR